MKLLVALCWLFIAPINSLLLHKVARSLYRIRNEYRSESMSMDSAPQQPSTLSTGSKLSSPFSPSKKNSICNGMSLEHLKIFHIAKHFKQPSGVKITRCGAI